MDTAMLLVDLVPEAANMAVARGVLGIKDHSSIWRTCQFNSSFCSDLEFTMDLFINCSRIRGCPPCLVFGCNFYTRASGGEFCGNSSKGYFDVIGKREPGDSCDEPAVCDLPTRWDVEGTLTFIAFLLTGMALQFLWDRFHDRVQILENVQVNCMDVVQSLWQCFRALFQCFRGCLAPPRVIQANNQMVPVAQNQLVPANNPEDCPAILDIGMPQVVPAPRLYLPLNQQPNLAPIAIGSPIDAAVSSQPTPSNVDHPPTNPFARTRDQNAAATEPAINSVPATSTPVTTAAPNFESTPIKSELPEAIIHSQSSEESSPDFDDVTPKADPDDSGNQTTLSDTPPERPPRSTQRTPRLCENHLVVDPALAQAVASASRIPVPKTQSAKSQLNEDSDGPAATPKREAAKKAKKLINELSREGKL